MANKALYNERKEIINKAFNCEKPSRVPIFSNFWTWKMLDSEYTLIETLTDYDIMMKVTCDFHERYQFDSYFDLGTRNPYNVIKKLGGSDWQIQVDEESGAIFVNDHALMESDEYDEFVNNKEEFYWHRAFARYVPNVTLGQLDEAAKEYVKFNDYSARVAKKFVEEYECVPVPTTYLKQPFEYFFTALRGLKGTALDLRRNPKKIIESCRSLYEQMSIPLMERVFAIDTSAFMCDMYTAFLGHSILNRKQFEAIYWPILKDAIDRFIANNKKLLIQSEANLDRFIDFFQDIPTGTVAIEFEQDDIFQMRKELPKTCILGGMPTMLLGSGTPEECVDYVKKLIDGMGEGYILSQDKMISFRSDCKRENLLAVNNFAREYKL